MKLPLVVPSARKFYLLTQPLDEILLVIGTRAEFNWASPSAPGCHLVWRVDLQHVDALLASMGVSLPWHHSILDPKDLS